MIGGWDDCTLKTMSLFILIVAAKQDFRRRAKPRHRADSSDRFSYKLRHMATKGFEYVPGLKANLESKGWWHSFELPDGRRIDGVNTVESLRKRIEVHTIPQDLSGARVLDIGAWDGWYSFEMERRGAQVLAIDCWDNPHFHQIRAALKSRVEYRQMDVYELNPQTVGRFDIVLFMGVLYHLKHPLLGLEKVCAVTTGMAVVDSFILR